MRRAGETHRMPGAKWSRPIPPSTRRGSRDGRGGRSRALRLGGQLAEPPAAPATVRATAASVSDDRERVHEAPDRLCRKPGLVRCPSRWPAALALATAAGFGLRTRRVAAAPSRPVRAGSGGSTAPVRRSASARPRSAPGFPRPRSARARRGRPESPRSRVRQRVGPRPGARRAAGRSRRLGRGRFGRGGVRATKPRTSVSRAVSSRRSCSTQRSQLRRWAVEPRGALRVQLAVDPVGDHTLGAFAPAAGIERERGSAQRLARRREQLREVIAAQLELGRSRCA